MAKPGLGPSGAREKHLLALLPAQLFDYIMYIAGIGAPVYLIMSLVGYWAYGNTGRPASS